MDNSLSNTVVVQFILENIFQYVTFRSTVSSIFSCFFYGFAKTSE